MKFSKEQDHLKFQNLMINFGIILFSMVLILNIPSSFELDGTAILVVALLGLGCLGLVINLEDDKDEV